LAESIRVDTSVTASSEAAAKTMAQALTADKMNAELSKNNLPKVTFLTAPVFEAPKAASPPVAPPQAQVQIEKKEGAGSGGGVPLVGILVPILVVVILAIAYYVYKRRPAAKHLAVAHSDFHAELGMLGNEQGKCDWPVFYHGTSLEAAMNIQEVGFDVQRSGSNAGAVLGPGLYVTPRLEKANYYAKDMPHQGAIFHLHVHLGQCYSVTDNDVASNTMPNWQSANFDSAMARDGLIGTAGEQYCIKDPRHRVKIKSITLGHTAQAQKAGYSVRNGKLIKS